MKTKLVINPLVFFLFGFFYYLIVPYLSFLFIPNFYEFTPIEVSLKYIDMSFFTKYYFFDLFFIFISFYIGYKMSFKMKLNKINLFDKYNNSTKLPIIFILIIITLFLWLLFDSTKQKINLFDGYKSFNVFFLGQFSTVTFFTFFFMNYFKKKSIKVVFFGLILFEILILLGLGSRNIVVNGIITIILGYLYNNRQLLLKPYFYFLLLFAMLVVLFIGIWRTGYEIKIGTFVGILLAEPIFVLSSASVYLEMIGTRPMIGNLHELILSIINFIPTFIYPEKVNLFTSILKDKFQYSPFGASSILLNLYFVFGYLYPIYIISIGCFFGYIYRKALNSIFYRTVYFSIVPLLMFQFYNQHIYALFKLLFWNGFILPYMIFFFILVARSMLMFTTLTPTNSRQV